MVSNLVTLRIVGGEVHEIDVVVVRCHRFYLCLRRCSLQEDVACHFVLHVDALCACGRCRTVSLYVGIYRLAIFVIYLVTMTVFCLHACGVGTIGNGIVVSILILLVNLSLVVILIERVVTESTAHVDRQRELCPQVYLVSSYVGSFSSSKVEQ